MSNAQGSHRAGRYEYEYEYGHGYEYGHRYGQAYGNGQAYGHAYAYGPEYTYAGHLDVVAWPHPEPAPTVPWF
ncbi:hypothetical protein GXP76_10195, partial [Streptomyces sp. NP-1717]|nr:hypothetical protein [Streptomyces sp. NP-1717]